MYISSMFTTQTTPIIDDTTGNISLHNQQGATLVFEFFEADGTTPKDMSLRTVFLETEFNDRIQLSTGSSSNLLELEFTQGVFAAYADRRPFRYAILDETDTLHELLASGQIMVRGWA